MDILKIFNTTFAGGTILQYMSALFILLMTLLLNKLIGTVLKGKLARWALKTPGILDDLIISTFSKPLSFLLFTIGFYLTLKTLPLPHKIEEIFDQSVKTLVVLNFSYFLWKTIDLLIEVIKPLMERTESKLDDQLIPIIKLTGKIFIAMISVLLIIQNYGYNITSLWAGLGIGGLAVALAARETLANFFGSITIFADRPFHIGDLVEVDNFKGFVDNVGLRSTRIRTLDGTRVTIPNSKLADSYIHNITERDKIRKSFTLGITYESGVEKVKKALQIIEEILNQRKDLVEEEKVIRFREFGPHSLDIHVIYWFSGTDWNAYLQAEEEINLEILRRFDEEGIEIAIPSQTVYVKGAGIPEESLYKH